MKPKVNNKTLIVLSHPSQFFLSPPHHPQVGDRSFPLEAVKQLMELMDLDDNVSPHLAETSIVAVCTNPVLPQVFQPVCQGKGAAIVFSKLGKTERMEM
uniref:Guanylate cyclase activator 2B n=1 Tax=Sander lucioperca TaxID=283035 RepID=A0A8C9ZUL1_SANLU